MRRRVLELIILTTVYYNAPDYQLDVYQYKEEKQKVTIEVTCAEGVTDCKDEPKKEEVQRVYNVYDSLYNYSPYVFNQHRDY